MSGTANSIPLYIVNVNSISLYMTEVQKKKSHNPPWTLDSFVFNSMSPLLMYLNIHTQYNHSKARAVSLTVRPRGSAYII